MAANPVTLFSTLKPFPCRRWSTENLVPIRPMEGQELPMHMVSFSIRARNTPGFSTRPGRLTLGGSGFCGSSLMVSTRVGGTTYLFCYCCSAHTFPRECHCIKIGGPVLQVPNKQKGGTARPF